MQLFFIVFQLKNLVHVKKSRFSVLYLKYIGTKKKTHSRGGMRRTKICSCCLLSGSLSGNLSLGHCVLRSCSAYVLHQSLSILLQ